MRTALLIFCFLADDPIALEKRTEQFANRLLTVAADWRRGDAEALAKHFTDKLDSSVFPETMGPPRGKLVGSIRHAAPKHREQAPAIEVARNLIAFAKSHGEVKHVSLQPIGTDLVYPVKYEVIGELPDGRRRWSKGTMLLRDAGGKIDSIYLQGVRTIASRRRIFHDVGLPGTDPAVLDHPTLGLAAYGAAVADVNGDGKIDLFSTGHDGNVLFLNFREAVPVKTPRQATAPLFLDFDNDGDPDLFCSANGAQMLLENRDGKFVDISEKAGVAVKSIGFTATAGDVNGDRVPDIYVAAYHNYGPVAPSSWDDAHNGLPNLFFVSNGDGTYTESAAKYGVAGSEWSYACQFLDVNGDGKLDLYVANDFGAGNNLFLREGDKFVDRAKEWGVWDGGYGMGVDFGDFDNDGKLDLYVTKMSSTAGNRLLDRTGKIGRLRELASGNTLYRNLGDRFEATTFPFPAGWAWGGGFLDIDNDGYEDLYAPNGHMSGASEKDT
ncbi:MAG: FG-GAP repeat domain-containing protein [Planctomycetota bacterium]